MKKGFWYEVFHPDISDMDLFPILFACLMLGSAMMALVFPLIFVLVVNVSFWMLLLFFPWILLARILFVLWQRFLDNWD